MEILAESIATAIINAPFDTVHLTEWLFTLTDDEYKACSKSHLGAGASFSKDGKRLSINVEKVADNFLVQHYIEDISERHTCRVKSLSNSFSPLGPSTLTVIWELKVRERPAGICELINAVSVIATPHFLSLLNAAGVSDLSAVKAGMTGHLQAHNLEETPLFAKDIERKAIAALRH